MTTEEKAKAYAEKIIKNDYGISGKTFREAGCRFGYEDVVQAYEDSATEALASQWVSVEERLPEDEETVLTRSSYGPVLAYYSKQDEMWFAYGNYGDITPTHWLPIPPLKGGDA